MIMLPRSEGDTAEFSFSNQLSDDDCTTIHASSPPLPLRCAELFGVRPGGGGVAIELLPPVVVDTCDRLLFMPLFVQALFCFGLSSPGGVFGRDIDPLVGLVGCCGCGAGRLVGVRPVAVDAVPVPFVLIRAVK